MTKRGDHTDFHPKVGKRHLIASNARFSIFLDDISCDGEPETRNYLVVVPKHSAPNMITGVGVLPICGDKIGLIQVYRHPIGEEIWEIPHGFVESEEPLKISALRELDEETGLECAPEALLSLGPMTPDAGILGGRVMLYVARNCVQKRPFKVSELGHRRFRLFDLSEIRRMIRMSEIQDSYTLISFFRYEAMQTGLLGPMNELP